MKLTIKTLVKLTFQVEIEPDKTVKELKSRIESEQGKDYPSAAQKLIYNGKILADENKLSEYEFDEKKFIVLMITRAPPAPKPAANNDSLTSANKQKNDEKVKPAPSTRQSQATTATTSANVTTPSSTAPTEAVSSNPSSTPATVTTTASNPTSRQQPLTTAARNLSDMVGEPQMAARLAALMSQPQFRQMQDLIQQSPHLLSSTIESLAASDPEMYNFISENPDVFVNALNHPPLAGIRPSGQQQSVGGRGQARGNPQQPGGQQPITDGMPVVGVSQHDREAIDRLKELGFSEYLAVQAYMACDKDEQLAANLLFQMD